MMECSCTCMMCRLYGHRPELLHDDGCPERKPKSDGEPTDGELLQEFVNRGGHAWKGNDDE